MNVTFKIPPGTATSSWNSAAIQVEVFVGQTLTIQNMDSLDHQLHTGGEPFGHGNRLAPNGGQATYVIQNSYSQAANGAVYDHLSGSSSRFYLIAYDGSALYQQNCASCHGALASSTKKKKSVNQIRAAISGQPDMKTLSFLTQRQIEAISFALSK